jgi:hypothetical protein
MTDTKNIAPAGIDLDKLWSKAEKGQYITRSEQFALIALARRAEADAPAADERALYMQAQELTYPIPSSPHASVVQRAMDDRIAFTKGWDAARAALSQPFATCDCAPEDEAFCRAQQSITHPIGQVSPAIGQGAATDAQQIAELILADPDGGYMRISSDLEHCDDGAMRFTVTNPQTGRRFGVHLGLAELRNEESSAAPAPVCHAPADERIEIAQLLSSAVENMRSTEPNIEARFRLAFKLEQLAKRFYQTSDATGKDEDTQEPVAWLRFWSAQYSMGEGNIGVDEGLEVCDEGDIGMDGRPAFPVYATPAAATGKADDASAADAMDAARYRWLRNESRDCGDPDYSPIVVMMDWTGAMLRGGTDDDGIRSGKDLDAAVDEAMAASRNGGRHD